MEGEICGSNAGANIVSNMIISRPQIVRSQPQMLFDWKTGKQLLPLDLGLGRVFKFGRQDMSCFVESFQNVSYEGPAPKYGITFGSTLLHPDF